LGFHFPPSLYSIPAASCRSKGWVLLCEWALDGERLPIGGREAAHCTRARSVRRQATAVRADTARAPASLATLRNVAPTNTPDCSLASKAGGKTSLRPRNRGPLPPLREHPPAAAPLPSLGARSCQEVLPRAPDLFLGGKNRPARATRSDLKYSQHRLAFPSYGSLGKKKENPTKHKPNHSVLKSNRNQILLTSSSSSSRGTDGWRRPPTVCLPPVSRSTFCRSFAHCSLQTDNKKSQREAQRFG